MVLMERGKGQGTSGKSIGRTRGGAAGHSLWLATRAPCPSVCSPFFHQLREVRWQGAGTRGKSIGRTRGGAAGHSLWLATPAPCPSVCSPFSHQLREVSRTKDLGSTVTDFHCNCPSLHRHTISNREDRAQFRHCIY